MLESISLRGEVTPPPLHKSNEVFSAKKSQSIMDQNLIENAWLCPAGSDFGWLRKCRLSDERPRCAWDGPEGFNVWASEPGGAGCSGSKQQHLVRPHRVINQTMASQHRRQDSSKPSSQHARGSKPNTDSRRATHLVAWTQHRIS